MYSQTLAMDLVPSEEELFAKLHSTARRHIRAPGKKGLVLRPVTDPALGDRLESIFNETFRRTGTVPEQRPWEAIIKLSAAEPTRSRVVGIFDDAVPTPDGLIAFAWGCAQGRYATYEAGASVRRPDLGNTPLSYAPLWDLITWARRDTGSTQFDLGGITSGGPNDPRHGISEFKRYFSDNIVQVAEEWTMEPAPLRASLARAISSGVRRAAELRERARAARTEAVREEPQPAAPAPAPEKPPAPSAPTT
jgi:lipid II:glycine glycyltransferase (peptidoglycan interpeptide bridge formation enzyme)